MSSSHSVPSAAASRGQVCWGGSSCLLDSGRCPDWMVLVPQAGGRGPSVVSEPSLPWVPARDLVCAVYLGPGKQRVELGELCCVTGWAQCPAHSKCLFSVCQLVSSAPSVHPTQARLPCLPSPQSPGLGGRACSTRALGSAHPALLSCVPAALVALTSPASSSSWKAGPPASPPALGGLGASHYRLRLRSGLA